jgi:predicted DNA-binding transcriptional regulator AlpA
MANRSTATTEVTTDQHRLLTPAEVAVKLGVTENALAIWRYYRRGPNFFKLGRAVRYDEDEVEQFKRDNTQECRHEIRNLRRR